MNKLLIKKNAALFGCVMIISGLVLRSITFDYGNLLFLGTAFFALSVGIGFLLAAIFSKDSIGFKKLSKYTLIPVCITGTFFIMNKFSADMPLLKGSILFIINIVFFFPEIKKAADNAEIDE